MEASSSASAAALAEGKTKLILPTSDPRQVLVLSKDSITAGNGLKVTCPSFHRSSTPTLLLSLGSAASPTQHKIAPRNRDLVMIELFYDFIVYIFFYHSEHNIKQ
jgi:hypothetical protein